MHATAFVFFLPQLIFPSLFSVYSGCSSRGGGVSLPWPRMWSRKCGRTSAAASLLYLRRVFACAAYFYLNYPLFPPFMSIQDTVAEGEEEGLKLPLPGAPQQECSHGSESVGLLYPQRCVCVRYHILFLFVSTNPTISFMSIQDEAADGGARRTSSCR